MNPDIPGMPGIIAFGGAAGAYSDLSCREVFPEGETMPCATFEDAFEAVENGMADAAMIPIDNTLAGRVADVHRLIPKNNLHIIGEHFQPIRHMLMGLKGAKLSDLKTVYSHIHALPQCQKMIKRLNLKQEVHADTAGAAQKILEIGNIENCAVASRLAAEIYGLDIIEEDVQDENHNTTRFLILSKEAHIPEYDPESFYITSFIFGVRNIPAALYKALGGFATNSVNMTKLESYVGENFQAAQFYADVIGHPEQRALQLAMEELGFFAKDIQLLGTYQAHPFRKIAI